MARDLYWQAIRWLALEHVRLREEQDVILADGLIVGSFDGAPLRLRYQLECDGGWRTKAVRIDDVFSDDRIDLEHRGDEGWRDSTGKRLPELAAAIDVDIAATPFTNTLPIRRLGLDRGRAAEITAVYIAVTPSLSLRPVRQRYTRLSGGTGDNRYLYESLESDFKRELVIDTDGFVVDYPGVWHRAAVEDPG